MVKLLLALFYFLALVMPDSQGENGFSRDFLEILSYGVGPRALGARG